MIHTVWAREPLPPEGTPSVFLAGPTPRAGGPVSSWRPPMIEMIRWLWRHTAALTLLTPESRGGVRAAHYDDQFEWETAARARATVRLFWIPRDVVTMPGFTTNVEFGHDVATSTVVLGCPPDCANPERNRYLIALAHRHGAPVRTTRQDTAITALDLVRDRLLAPLPALSTVASSDRCCLVPG